MYDTSQIPEFDKEVRTVEFQANAVVDGRHERGLDSRGAFFEGFFGKVPGTQSYEYIHYGAEASYTFNLNRATRLLTFRLATEAVDGEKGQIPFSELPRLGGHDRLRGYMEGRFRDKRAVLGSVEFHYPIHQNLHGILFIDSGSVAEDYGSLLRDRRLRFGYGGGFVVGSAQSGAFQLELAYGDGLRFFLTTDLARAFNERTEQL